MKNEQLNKINKLIEEIKQLCDEEIVRIRKISYRYPLKTKEILMRLKNN